MKRKVRADPFRQVVAANVRELRAKHGWTQQELATRAGVSQKTISRLESGMDNVRWDLLDYVAQALSCGLSDLRRSRT